MRVLVAGAGGMVGRALSAHCESLGDEVLSYDRQSLDIADLDAVSAVLQKDTPDVVINCAAWTNVDGCESDRDHALHANGIGPENLAHASREVGAGFITISTDYVFDGSKNDFYTQRDDPNPQSVYAWSKLEGERRSQVAYARTIVVRSGFIFGPGGKNFLSTVVNRAKNGDSITAINDAWGTPTYAFDLAAQLRRLASLDLPGVFHVVNGGQGATYEEFAAYLVEVAGLDARVIGITSDSIKRPAARPVDSRLKCLFSERLGLPQLQSWRDAAKDFVFREQTQMV